MDILFKGQPLIEDVVITKAAEHEEELMKSDFVKLSWRDATFRELPVGAYILPYDDGVKYKLLEPYTPEQKTENEWLYEPQFHHEKMYAGKVTFEIPTSDTEQNPISLIDWDFSGMVGTLLTHICNALNTALELTGDDVIKWYPIGVFDEIIDVQFSANDIISALTKAADACKCEWHIDWENKTLWFGHIIIEDINGVPNLTVGDNVNIPSTRDSKEGYYNAFLPQGSTRNITRMAVSGEAVQSTVRLSLDRTTYPDGIIYTDGDGHVLTKAQFEKAGMKKFLKALIFEDVYPKQDAYIYNVRYRERYKLDDQGNKVVASEDAQGNKTYLRYAEWFFRIGICDANNQWTDYRLGKRGYADISAFRKARVAGETRDILLILDIPYSDLYFMYGSKQVTVKYEEKNIQGEVIATAYLPMFDFKGKYTNQSGETIVIGDNQFALYINEYAALAGEVDMDAQAFADAFDIVYDDVHNNATIEFAGGVRISNLPNDKKIGNIIDGKKPVIAFQPNKEKDAMTTPLAGQGTGDGEGHYGFEIGFLDGNNYDDTDYALGSRSIAEMNQAPTEEGDTGIRDAITDNADVVADGDFYILFQQNGNFIKPTIKSEGGIPKGAKTPSKLNNLVNIYNVVLNSSFENAAKTVLAEKTLEYISDSLTDKNSYTVKSNPVVFEQSNPSLFIGKKVNLVVNGNTLETRVMKLVTHLDYDFEQEITVGNEVLKGSQSQLRDQVNSLVSGGAGRGGQGGGGVSQQMVKNLIREYTDPRFLSKQKDDEAAGKILFDEGFNVGKDGHGMKPNGDIRFNDAVVDGSMQSNNFVHGVDTGKGWKIDDKGNAEFESATIRSYLEVLELLVNRIQAQEGDTIFSDNDQIERVTERVVGNTTTYILDLKEKWDGYVTPQKYGNILKGIINTLAAKEAGVSDETEQSGQSEDDGGNKYYTSWMHVVNTHNTDPNLGLNQIEVVVYGDSDVPAQRNFEPCPMMVIARRGCIDYSDPTDPNYESVKADIVRRQRFFEISASDGRVTKFTGVSHPLLANYNYGVTIGELPDFVKQYAKVQEVLSVVGEHTDWLYAKGIVIDNYIHVDVEGVPVPEVVDCGDWIDGSRTEPLTIQIWDKQRGQYVDHVLTFPIPSTEYNKSDSLYIGHGIYFNNKYNALTQRYETHKVRHSNGTWLCLRDEPVISGGQVRYNAPHWNSAYWRLTDGNGNYSIEFDSSRGYSFRRGYVNTDITPHLFYGNVDITDDVDDEYWNWTRCSESTWNDGHPVYTDQDRTWNSQHEHVKAIHLSNADMPVSWSSADKAIFTCSVTVYDGLNVTIVNNQIIS